MGDRIAERPLCLADRHRDGDREAALARASEGAVGDDLRGQFHIGIGEDDDMVLGAALALHSFAVAAERT